MIAMGPLVGNPSHNLKIVVENVDKLGTQSDSKRGIATKYF
jgi:hypothetical protein